MHYYNILSDITKDSDLYKTAISSYNNYELDLGGNHHEAMFNVLSNFKDFLRRNKIEEVNTNDSNMVCNGIKGYLTIQDIFALYSMALKVPKDGIIYEIGSYMGLSSSIMASALKATNNLNAKIYCVDLFEIFSVEKFVDNLNRTGLGDFIIPIKSDSVKAAELFPDKSGDLIFLDADHKFEGSFADLNAWYPKVNNDGVFTGHDYYNNGVDEVQKSCGKIYIRTETFI